MTKRAKIPHDLAVQVLGAAKAQYRDNVTAIAEAHIDSGLYGCGWLKVDAHGNLKRVNPLNVILKGEPK